MWGKKKSIEGGTPNSNIGNPGCSNVGERAVQSDCQQVKKRVLGKGDRGKRGREGRSERCDYI